MFSMSKKTIINLAVAISFLFLTTFVSCSSFVDEPKKASKNGTPYSVGRLENTGYTYDGSGDFSKGYAFVRLSYCKDPGFDAFNRTELIGCINTNGNLQYCIERQDNQSYYVKNGRMQILEDISDYIEPLYDRWICLDEQGQVCYEYDASSSNSGHEASIVCGGPFILVKERDTGFETTDNYTYKIIDDKGNVVLEYNDTLTNPFYCGNGVFFLDSNNAGRDKIGEHGNTVLFNAETGDFFETAPALSGFYFDTFENGVLSLRDGTYIELDQYIDYDYIVYEDNTNDTSLFENIAENGFIICKKDGIPFIYDFRNKEVYDCFNDIGNHKARFFHYNDKIVTIVRGDDSILYLKIVDQKGKTIKELTKLEKSNYDLDSVSYVFYDNKIELSYMESDNIIVCNADLESGEISYETIKEKGRILLLSDYHDGVAKNTFYDYYTSGMNRKIWNYKNYVNREGHLLFDVDDFNQPIIYIKDSEIKIF